VKDEGDRDRDREGWMDGWIEIYGAIVKERKKREERESAETYLSLQVLRNIQIAFPSTP